MNDQNIKQLALSLKLFGIADVLAHRLEQASMQNLTPIEVLTLFLEDEALHRKNVAVANLQKKATFRRSAILESLETSVERGLSATKLRELSQLGFWQFKKNLILVGATGVGKTALSTAIGKEACSQSLSVKFWSVEELLEEVHMNKATNRSKNFMKKLSSTNVIILDDFGLRPYTHEEALFFLRFLEDRYKTKVLIISSQVDTSSWKSLFEDKVIADAITDRLLNPSEKVVLTGCSQRGKTSALQTNATTPLT